MLIFAILTEGSHYESYTNSAFIQHVYIGLVETKILYSSVDEGEFGGVVTELQSPECMHCCSINQPRHRCETTNSDLQDQW